jgi:cyclic pyranopterin phosphate synthase
MEDHSKKKEQLSHLDDQGNARMVDVGSKQIQKRVAEATGLVRMAPDTLRAIKEEQVKKGNVLAVARIAGIQAAKATPTLIPLCHPLPLDAVEIAFEYSVEGIEVTCSVSCQARTGVEMEALTGVSVALLAIYDMCKAIDKGMALEGIRLIRKRKEDL